jgi:uncharacterized protein with FMN-binding domain
MRRVALAIVGTTIGTVLMIGLKAPGGAGLLGYSAQAPGLPGALSGPGSLAPPAAPSAGVTATRAPATKPTAKRTSAPGSGGGSTTKATATRTTTAPPASRTILGAAYAAAGFGSMQVKIVVTGTHIDDIITVRQSNRPKTVATTLRAQALSAQSANVGNVSGATYSSNAWKSSLQSAISQI